MMKIKMNLTFFKALRAYERNAKALKERYKKIKRSNCEGLDILN